MLGVAGGALLVLAERAQDAEAQTVDPPLAPTIPTVPEDLPPVTVPPAPAPPPVHAPALPTAPNVPPALPLPARVAPTVPAAAIPEVPAPVPPVVPPAPDVHGAPTAPGIRGIDPHRVSGTVGPLTDVPEVSTPEATLPELPELPNPAVPLDGLLDLSAAPPSAAPAPVNAPDLAPSAPVADTAPSRFVSIETGGVLAGIDSGSPPARGPPSDAPGSPHRCPGGGSTHPTRADPAALLPPGADDASRQAGLLAEARGFASALLLDPLLRPD
jgi:hypothetical protein